ncbi:MAG: hypothetical protein IJ196_06360 [Prevotella sp.]|nr:hypothetical protein [Prevotella sp.]
MIKVPLVAHSTDTLAQFHVLPYAPWGKDYPYQPHVEVALGHTGDSLLLHFRVIEQTVRAVAPGDNSRVWEDSCCEFFASPIQALSSLESKPGQAGGLFVPSCEQEHCGTLYYNFECNAAGRLLIGCGSGREGRELARKEILDSVERWSSLGKSPFEEHEAPEEWHLKLAIPITAFWHHQLHSFSGLRMKTNIYKCGDKLRQPHFLSLFPISTATPDFHRPDFFQELIFE